MLDFDSLKRGCDCNCYDCEHCVPELCIGTLLDYIRSLEAVVRTYEAVVKNVYGGDQ